MSSEVECPVEGCDYSGLRDSVLGHYSGSRDGNHSGGYFVAEQRVPRQTDSQDQEQSSTSESNPIMTQPTSQESETEKPDEVSETKNTNQESEPVCPECSGEVVDFTAYDSGEYHNVNGSDLFVRGDYVCTECGGWFVDE